MRRYALVSSFFLACLSACTSPLVDAVDRELARGASLDSIVVRIEAGPANGRREAYRRLALGRLEADARSSDQATRERAFAAYGAIGPKAVPSLETLAHGSDADVASRADLLLARLGDRRARSRLLSDLDSSDDVRLGRALSVAGTTLPASRLEALLSNPNARVRLEAARALEARAVPSEDLLVDVARHDPDSAVRAQACRAAAKTGTAPRVLAVVDEERVPSVRASCLRALVPLLSASTLRDRLSAIPLSLDERGVEEIGAIYTTRDEDVRDALDARLPAWLEVERPSIRAAVANVLPTSASSERARSLRARLSNERVSTVRVALSARLLSIAGDDPAARDALAGVAGEPSLDGIEASALLFARGDRARLAALRNALDDPSPAIRVVAARALGDEPTSAASLARRLDDSDPGVRSAVAIALAR